MKNRMKKLLSLILALTFILSLSTAFASVVEAAPVKIYGIDVSKYQSKVDWAKVKASGVDFVIIRAGYSGVIDPYFESHYAGAKAVGLNVGAYIYSYAATTSAAVTDAENMKKWLAGKTFEYPIYFDIEDAKQESLTTAQRMALIDTFCAEMEKAGYFAGVYAGRYWMDSKLDAPTLRAKYSVWEAQYLNSGTDSSDRSSRCNIWQYSSSGTVPGISGNVDMNVSYVDYPTMIKSKGLNGFDGSDTPPTVDKTRGYYVTTGDLNMRSGVGTSYPVVEVLYKNTEVALIGFNEAKTWGNIIHGDNIGWASLSYLNFVRNFDYTLTYEMNMASAAQIPSASIALGSKTDVAGKGLVVDGYALSGWYLKRASDGAWLTASGWKANAADNEKTLYTPESQLVLDDSLVNMNAGDDVYTLSGVWVNVFEEPDEPAIGRGYYEVATNSGGLNMRSAPNTSSDIIVSIPKGTTVAIIGVNEDGSWANVLYNGQVGWLSISYLKFIRDFRYTFSYDMANSSASQIAPSVLSYGATLTVSGASADGYVLDGWTLKRSSDGAVFTSEGWKTDSSAGAVLMPGDKLTVNSYLTNYYAGDDTFTLTAVWTENKGEEPDPDDPALPVGRGYYEIATSSSGLNMRSGPSTSDPVIVSIPKGTVVAIIGLTDDGSWANAIYNGQTGWLSAQYLNFVRDFEYTFKYDMAMSAAPKLDSVVLSYGDKLTVPGEGVVANGYVIEGWSIERASDGAWLTSEGWKTGVGATPIVFPGYTLTVDTSLINLNAGDDTFTLNAVWTENGEADPVLGDCDGNGTVNAADLRIMKMYLAGAIDSNEIILSNADINGDGITNAVDYALIKKLITK